MAEKTQTAFRLSSELLARVDAVRGSVSRTALVERLLVEWVGQGDGAVSRPVTSVTGPSRSQSSRPPAEPSSAPIPVVDRDGRRMRVSVAEPRPWRQHHPTCSCAVCKPPRDGAA